MKTKLRVVVEDPLATTKYKLAPAENIWISNEPFFLSGPVAERVAIIDRDPETGQLRDPVKWSSKDPQIGYYSIPEELTSPGGIAISVFGLVLKTLALFERDEILGHRVKWAFDSPQLLVVPNAGTWQNAFYDRYSRSLQCFSFKGPEDTPIYTALSSDIVTHETGHAILDGLTPALYDALTPQSLAIHEAIGDLTAIIMSLQSSHIREWLINECGGKLSGNTPISQLAVEFGYAMGMGQPLRDANNQCTMGNRTSDEPHDLSRILTGAFWSAIKQVHNTTLEKAKINPDAQGKTDKGKIGYVLGSSTRDIRCMLFRALDYIPPAETTFTDYCRAVLRADEVLYPNDDSGYRKILKNEFLTRGIINNIQELECTPEVEWIDANLDEIMESDWTAYAFAEKIRSLLKIPSKIPFRLFPRRDVKRRYRIGHEEYRDSNEFVFQVTWEKPEENIGTPGLSSRRSVFHGTTIVFGREPNKKGQVPVLSCLTTDRSDNAVQSRNNMVSRLNQLGQLDIGSGWNSFSSRLLTPKVFGRVTDNMLRLRGTARLLHLTEVL
jgi:hypothetical protein